MTDGTVHDVETPDILSCDEYRYFWISWISGWIDVGRGHIVGSSRFLAWLELERTAIATVNVASGFTSDSWWLFGSLIGTLAIYI
jgi:Farnesoic acid 0-methyl transferase